MSSWHCVPLFFKRGMLFLFFVFIRSMRLVLKRGVLLLFFKQRVCVFHFSRREYFFIFFF